MTAWSGNGHRGIPTVVHPVKPHFSSVRGRGRGSQRNRRVKFDTRHVRVTRSGGRLRETSCRPFRMTMASVRWRTDETRAWVLCMPCQGMYNWTVTRPCGALTSN